MKTNTDKLLQCKLKAFARKSTNVMNSFSIFNVCQAVYLPCSIKCVYDTRTNDGIIHKRKLFVCPESLHCVRWLNI